MWYAGIFIVFPQRLFLQSKCIVTEHYFGWNRNRRECAKDTWPADPTLSGLMEVAERLRHLPDDRFKMRLSRELQAEFQRRSPMTASTPIGSTADEFVAIHTVIPFICVPEGDKLIEFMKRTFGAGEVSRHPHHGPDGFVASVRIGDSDLLIMGGESLRGQECPAALHVFVKDCDATYQRALDAGAVTIGSPGVGEPADRPYGERSAFVSDPFGNYWFIATRLGPDYVGAGLRHVTPSLLPPKAEPLIDFLKRAFGAKVEGLHEQAGRVVHAFVRIGEAVVEMSEAEERLRPFGFYMHTEDVDAVYHRALAAGAISVLPPADQPFGDRLAIFQDPAGNRWFAAKRIAAGQP
jgi:PhnB protein